jgi:V/A-type H+-transporting ATPase subunit E
MTEMTSGIGDLLERLRKDGVEAGESEKQRILRETEAEAATLLADAKKRAEEIVAAAESEARAKKKQLDSELNLAARDFALRFAERVKRQIIQPLVRGRVDEALASPDVLKAAITELVREKTGGAKISVSPETQNRLDSFFQNELRRLLDGGTIEVASESGLSGFRLQRQGESFIWDVTGEAIAGELATLVEPTLRKHLQLLPPQR